MAPHRLVMLVFFLQPIAFGSWLPRIPELQQRLALGPAELAIALLGLPLGTVITLTFAGPLVARIGARTAIRIGFVAFLAAVSIPAFAGHIAVLFGGLLLTGVAMSVLELGLNVMADETERAGTRAIMSTCHGFWSLGMATGSLIGVGLAALGLAPQWSILAVAALVMVPAQLAARQLPVWPVPDPVASAAKPRGLFIPEPILLGICIFAVGCAVVEGAAADWSAVYLRDVFSADAAQAGIGYTGFALMVTLGRFLGDAMKTRWGAVAVARLCAATALAGVALIVTSPAYLLSLAGFALAGFGVSVAFPLAVTAAAAVGNRPAAANVAMLSLVTLSGFLLGPPVIGAVGQHLGLRLGLAMLLPGLASSVVLAAALQPRSRRSQAAALPIGNGK